MSEQGRALARALGKILNRREEDIGESFSLEVPKLKSSAGSVILRNVVKKVCQRDMDCSGVETFGDLLRKIEGGASGPEEGAASPAAAMPPAVSGGTEHGPEAGGASEAPEQPAAGPGGVNGLPPGGLNGLACGIDIQDFSLFPEAEDYWTDPFYREHFTDEEIAYCAASEDPRGHFAVRWCVKEALKKCGPLFLALPFQDIQVRKRRDGGGVL